MNLKSFGVGLVVAGAATLGGFIAGQKVTEGRSRERIEQLETSNQFKNIEIQTQDAFIRTQAAQIETAIDNTFLPEQVNSYLAKHGKKMSDISPLKMDNMKYFYYNLPYEQKASFANNTFTKDAKIMEALKALVSKDTLCITDTVYKLETRPDTVLIDTKVAKRLLKSVK